MRALILSVLALGLAGAVVLVGGRMVNAPIVAEEPDGEAVSADAVGSTNPAEPEKPAGRDVQTTAAEGSAPTVALPSQPTPEPAQAAAPEGALPAAPPPEVKDTARSRLVAPAIIAPPELGGELVREAPREPLSQLSLALPPKPEMKNEWAGTPFFRPLAIESAVFESGGRTIALSGVKSVPLDESCVYEGASWPCGVRARSAFRLWLRGRALVCQLPDEENEVTRARCRLAKQDAGAWLVANGWALADPDGPYVQAEEKARAEKLGIFGAPPDTSSISKVPDAPASTSTTASQPIMTEESIDPEPSVAPELAFPPAPPSP